MDGNGHLFAKNLVLFYTMSRDVTRCHATEGMLRVSTAKNFIRPHDQRQFLRNDESAAHRNAKAPHTKDTPQTSERKNIVVSYDSTWKLVRLA